ncbi:g12740 [Coccomyxa viridis]|uniref:G12740 protein n=1 Tax=Coccomyxa viridis TaxID=1274662 RepID=A0ABP1GFR4_9CHLO
MALVERDVVPDWLIRRGIRYLLSQRVADARKGGPEEQQKRKQAFVDELKSLPIAVQTSVANEQHYEVPTEYFLLVLGKHLKYSSCLYPAANTTLDEAEEAMLDLSCQRAQLTDGQSVLELGCGWGSMSLYMASRYPKSKITAVSNSKTQKELIDSRAKQRGLTNLEVITADVVHFDTKQRFDRVVSIEMFEHMKNYQALLRNIASWLKPEGLVFVHIFTHKSLAYHFEVKGEDDWMSKYFFSGGTMPSADLLHHFQDDVSLQQQWAINGKHYSRTLEDWLQRQDRQRAEVLPIMKETYGDGQGLKWMVYWRLFYLACSELFNYNGGDEWFVSHYLFKKR